MATFIQTEPLSPLTTSLASVDLEALANAGNEPESPNVSVRKATVRRPNAPSRWQRSADEPAPTLGAHRKIEISAEPIKNSVTQYRKTLVAKDETSKRLIREAVNACVLFRDLTDEGRNELVDAFRRVDAVLGEVLIREGDWGDLFYVLQEGQCEAFKRSSEGAVKVYGPGGSFGELALMYNVPRAASVKVVSSKAVTWAVDRMTFKTVSVQFKMLRQKQYEDALRKVRMLSLLSSEEIGRLIDSVEERVYGENQTAFSRGETGNEVFILIEGKATYATDSEQGTATVGDVFCEDSLLQDKPRTVALSTKAGQNCVVVSITKAKIEDMLGPAVFTQAASLLGSARPGMSKFDSFRTERPISMAPQRLQSNHRHHLAIKFEDLDMNLGSGTSSHGASAASLHIGPPMHGVMGSPMHMSSSPMHGPSALSKTTSGRFFRSDTINSVMSGATSASGGGGGGIRSSGEHQPIKTVEIVLGVGTFGKVIIVRHTLSGETYAMKRLNKSWIVENGLEQHVVDERNVMTLTDHPFILKLHNSYYDEKYVYLLLELCLGGELFMYLHKAGKFNEQQARFYAASIVQAFDHLHSKSIVYRDLKPENLMLDEFGYLKVVDFGLAKVVKGRTWTICGTPEYLAPEVVLSKGHNRAVDYWALGILIYELTAGVCPFTGDDNMVTYKLIVENQIEFPPHTTPLLRDIVRDFTKTAQLVRLGLRRPGIKAIREHSWFNSFDWVALDKLQMPPPIVPKVRSKIDVSNFEEYTGSDQDMIEAIPSDWKPAFPYQVIDGKTQLMNKGV